MSLAAESRALHDEMHELEALGRKVILAPGAKRRLEALPGEIAALHARIDAEAEAEQADVEALLAAHAEAQEDYLTALRTFKEKSERLKAVVASGKAQGIYLPKLSVILGTSSDPAMRNLLRDVRAQAFVVG
jgi:hypothetical protein